MTPPPFVLIHGAWGGAHTWRSVRPRLWSTGHHVFTPALTGIGERSHLVGPHVDLGVHVDDVANCILYEDLSNIVLVGFSYGGMVATGALERIADRVRHLVFLDAFVPADSQSVADLAPHLVPHPAHHPIHHPAHHPVHHPAHHPVHHPAHHPIDHPAHHPAAPPGTGQLDDGWLIAPTERTFDDADEAEFNRPRRTAQPRRTFTEPVRLSRALESFPFGRTYIKALGDPRRTDGPDPFWDAADRYREHPDWRYEELPSNHMVPQNQPDALTAILLSLD